MATSAPVKRSEQQQQQQAQEQENQMPLPPPQQPQQQTPPPTLMPRLRPTQNMATRYAKTRRPWVNRSGEEGRARRREGFLERGREARQEKRWEGRSDLMLRSDYLAEQQLRWMEESARLADEGDGELDVQDEEDLASSGVQVQASQMEVIDPASEVEQIAALEQLELEELVALAEEHELPLANEAGQRRYSEEYDDAEYESLFMDFMSDGCMHESVADAEPSMDMSTG